MTLWLAIVLLSPQADRLSFEAASIHRVQHAVMDAEGARDKIERNPSTLTMRNVTLANCVRWAYGLQSFQVTGPSWTDSDRYDIIAKAANATEPQLRLMLRTLLEERFKLRFHRDKKEMPAYILEIGKDGHKLRPSTEDGQPSLSPGRINVTVRRMALFEYLDLLSGPLGMPIVDKTGLTGRYDFEVDLRPYLPGPGDQPRDMGEVIRDALRDELGLLLTSRKMPVDVIVIDGAEKTPTEN